MSFPPLHFQSVGSFYLRWVSCRQHLCGSCFLTHSAALRLLIGTFNPFTFKVIIDRYVVIAILLFIGLTSSPSYLLLLLLLSPFNSSCTTGLGVMSSFSFSSSGKLLVSFILSESLAGYSHLGCRSLLFITVSISCQSLPACQPIKLSFLFIGLDSTYD